jgi:hypothetical protein
MSALLIALALLLQLALVGAVALTAPTASAEAPPSIADVWSLPVS